MVRSSFYTLFLLLSLLLHSQTRDKAFLINKELGRGINYGNMLEAPSEAAWGNPWKRNYPEIIADLGFNHVRIPVRWEPVERSSSSQPYTINPTFLNRVKEVVDASQEQGLYTIINMHHHEALFDNPWGQKDRFLTQWRQIAEFFKDYDDKLLFEILNEPHGNLSAELWNDYLVEALEIIRETNPDRVVLIGTPEFGGLGGLPLLEIPSDPNLILTIHYYNPFQFTHQGASWVEGNAEDWLGTKWIDSDLERSVIQNEFKGLVDRSKREGIPVHIGEFGAFGTADIESREKYTTYLARYFESMDWSWAYWEFSAGFGIYNPSNGSVVEPLVRALLSNELSEPLIYQRKTVYNSDFTTANDGWNAFGHQGAQTTLSLNESLQMDISNGGTELWHVQLLKTPINLQRGKKYVFSFTGKADAERTINFNVGMDSDPWTTYGSGTATLGTDTTSFFTVFDMQTSDPEARIGFDMGLSETNVTITKVMLEELTLENATILQVPEIAQVIVFPNPVTESLYIKSKGGRVLIFNTKGKIHQIHEVSTGISTIDVQSLIPGVYFAVIKTENKLASHRFVKE